MIKLDLEAEQNTDGKRVRRELCCSVAVKVPSV